MRVLHVNDCAGVAKNLIAGLKFNGIQAELFQPTVGTYRAGKIKRALLPITRTLEALRLRYYVRRNHIDIIHIHYATFAYMALITRLPYLLHCHGSDVNKDLNRPGLRNIAALGIRKSEKVFYSTPALYQPLTPLRSDAVFLPNPIDTSLFTPGSKMIENKPLRILSISKLDDFKGIPDILKTIELVWQVRPEIEFGLMGFGNRFIEAEPFIKIYGGKKNLILHSPLSHDKMPDLIRTYDIILGHQSARLPVLNVSELEAMACAKPVVCSFRFPKSYPEPPPILVSKNPEEARDHILCLIDDPNFRRNLGLSASQWVRSNHDINLVSKRLLNHYTELLNHNRHLA